MIKLKNAVESKVIVYVATYIRTVTVQASFSFILLGTPSYF